MTLRIYINEYNSLFIQQVSANKIEGVTTISKSEKVIIVEGEMAVLENIMSLMYEDDCNKIKAVFPSFKTEDDMNIYMRHENGKVLNELATSLIGMIHEFEGRGINYREHPVCNAMYEAYNKLMAI